MKLPFKIAIVCKLISRSSSLSSSSSRSFSASLSALCSRFFLTSNLTNGGAGGYISNIDTKLRFANNVKLYTGCLVFGDY